MPNPLQYPRAKWSSVLLLLLIVACRSENLQAQSAFTWDGGANGGNNNWKTGDNWVSNSAPPPAPPGIPGASLIFAGSIKTAAKNNNSPGSGFRDITIGSNTAPTAFILEGSRVTLNGNITTNAVSTATTNLQSTIDLELTLSAGNHTILTEMEGSWRHDLLISRVMGGSGNLIKDGGGILELSAANTYTGTTSVNSGTLLLSGDQSNATGNVSVAAGATLTGSGTLGGTTTVSGIHSPGNGPGIQTFNSNLTYTSGSSVEWELIGNTTVNSPLAFDQIVVLGNLNFSGSTTLDLNFNTLNGVNWTENFWQGANQSWLLYDVAGTTTGFDNLSINTQSWQDGFGNAFPSQSSFSLNQVGNSIYLNYSGVPEPSTFGLLALIFALLTVGVRKRRQLQS